MIAAQLVRRGGLWLTWTDTSIVDHSWINVLFDLYMIHNNIYLFKGINMTSINKFSSLFLARSKQLLMGLQWWFSASSSEMSSLEQTDNTQCLASNVRCDSIRAMQLVYPFLWGSQSVCGNKNDVQLKCCVGEVPIRTPWTAREKTNLLPCTSALTSFVFELWG